MALTTDQRQARRYKAALKELSGHVTTAVRAMDAIMKESESAHRGKMIAAILNGLEMANDRVRFFQLGVDWRKATKR